MCVSGLSCLLSASTETDDVSCLKEGVRLPVRHDVTVPEALISGLTPLAEELCHREPNAFRTGRTSSAGI